MGVVERTKRTARLISHCQTTPQERLAFHQLRHRSYWIVLAAPADLNFALAAGCFAIALLGVARSAIQQLPDLDLED